MLLLLTLLLALLLLLLLSSKCSILFIHSIYSIGLIHRWLYCRNFCKCLRILNSFAKKNISRVSNKNIVGTGHIYTRVKKRWRKKDSLKCFLYKFDRREGRINRPWKFTNYMCAVRVVFFSSFLGSNQSCNNSHTPYVHCWMVWFHKLIILRFAYTRSFVICMYRVVPCHVLKFSLSLSSSSFECFWILTITLNFK